MDLDSSFDWCSAERKHFTKNRSVDWGVVNTAPYDNITYTAHWYSASNWSTKPLDERVKILTNARKGQSMMGAYRPAPYAPYPTAENYAERVFKRIHDNISGKGYVMGIFWQDYKGKRFYK